MAVSQWDSLDPRSSKLMLYINFSEFGVIRSGHFFVGCPIFKIWSKSIHDTEGEQLQKPQLGKQNLPAPFGHVNWACMEVDELSHDVNQLGVAK
jgi:hypothetical protein